MRVGYSVFGKNRLDDAMASKLRESGIEVIEVGMSAEDFPDADFYDTAAVAKRYGLDIASIHLPIAPQRVYDVTNINATGAMAYQTELIKRAGEIFGSFSLVFSQMLANPQMRKIKIFSKNLQKSK